MGILFVNPSRRSKKRYSVSGRAKVRTNAKRSKKRRQPKALAAYWAKKRGKSKARRNPAKKKRGGSTKKRNVPMARKKRRARRGKRRTKRRARRKSPRRTKRRGRRRRKSPRRTKRRGRRRKTTKRRSRRRGRRTKRRSSKRRSKRRARRTKRKSTRRRSSSSAKTVVMRRGPHGTLVMNPRRRRKSSRRRRTSRRRGRRAVRRYGRRHYRKNPGGMLLDLAKRAAPVLIGLYGARMLVSKLGPKIPGLSRLGALQSPLLAVGAVLAVNFATKKIGKLAKYRSELLLGTGLNALDALISAFAPASVKAMIGVGDVYDRALGEYLHAGEGAPAEDPSMAMGEYVQMGEYVAVGGVEEELGVDEELGGVEEELGDQGSWGEGVSSNAMLRTVQPSQMLAPVPTRSYTRGVDPATQAWNDPRDFYQGIFAGGPQGSAWNPGD